MSLLASRVTRGRIDAPLLQQWTTETNAGPLIGVTLQEWLRFGRLQLARRRFNFLPRQNVLPLIEGSSEFPANYHTPFSLQRRTKKRHYVLPYNWHLVGGGTAIQS